jgi:triphosphatase
LPQETELKLDLTPEAVAAFVNSDILPENPVIAEQRSVYFDTREQDLFASGFSLRVRQSEGQRIQTVKAVGTSAAGMFARPEWERPVETDRPVLDDTTPIRTLLGDKANHIAPAFEVRVERRRWNVSREGAAIELVLDRGEVVACDRRTPVCEIELELKDGSPVGLFKLAREIDAVAPLRLGVLSKAERGYRLLGPAARVIKAEPIMLTADKTAATAFRDIAGACLRHFRLNEALLDNRDREALHQARVALRRLRSAFSIHKAMLEDGDFERLRGELCWLAGELSEARNVDVLLARADAPEVRSRLEQAGDAAYFGVEAAVGSGRARALMLDLSEWLVVGDWLVDPVRRELRDAPAKDFAASALDRFRKKVKKGESGGAKTDHGSGGIVPLRAAQKPATYFPSATTAGGLGDLYRGIVSEGPSGLF